jgi:hypothetical protein
MRVDCPLHFNITGALLDTMDDAIRIIGIIQSSNNSPTFVQLTSAIRGKSSVELSLDSCTEARVGGGRPLHVVHKFTSPAVDTVGSSAFTIRNMLGVSLRLFQHQQQPNLGVDIVEALSEDHKEICKDILIIYDVYFIRINILFSSASSFLFEEPLSRTEFDSESEPSKNDPPRLTAFGSIGVSSQEEGGVHPRLETLSDMQGFYRRYLPHGTIDTSGTAFVGAKGSQHVGASDATSLAPSMYPVAPRHFKSDRTQSSPYHQRVPFASFSAYPNSSKILQTAGNVDEIESRDSISPESPPLAFIDRLTTQSGPTFEESLERCLSKPPVAINLRYLTNQEVAPLFFAPTRTIQQGPQIWEVSWKLIQRTKCCLPLLVLTRNTLCLRCHLTCKRKASDQRR